jgi:hypothetical protein
MQQVHLLRPKETWKRLGCGHSKFEEHYRFHSAADPNVPDTKIPRVKAVPLGERNIAFLEHEIDDLIDGLAELRDTPVSVMVERTPIRKASTTTRRKAGSSP